MLAVTRRLPALAALLIAALVAVLTAAVLVRLIEARSHADVTNALRLGGISWAGVAVDGLQVRIAGTAPSEAARFQALSAAAGVVDSARVIDDMRVVEAAVEAPRFSIEILRNGAEVSLIGLIPRAMPHEELIARITALDGVEKVTDLLDSSNHPVPERWDQAVDFALEALAQLPRSKLSVAADAVSISAISESAAEQRRLEAEIARAAPKDLRLMLDINAPRPAITPFVLRFVIDDAGRARFDACSADTEEARERIRGAAAAAGLLGTAACTIGLGAPSPRWGTAAAAGIEAVGALGAGSVTISDGDVSLVAAASVSQQDFDAVVGKLEQELPDAFSLTSVLSPPEPQAGVTRNEGPPEFVATLGADGAFGMRGRVGSERDRAAIGGYARALFGASRVSDTTRLDELLPELWAVRVLAALEAMRGLEAGGALVQPDFVEIHGTTGDPDAPAEISRLLSAKLGDGARFEIAVTYDQKLDPVLGLPTADECVAEINGIIGARKIVFAPGAADLDPSAGQTLDGIAALMKNCADYPMEVGGHTDSQGREEMNQALSQSRAEAVIEALLGRRALTGNLSARGYGESTPIADNGTEAGREANRRIEFRLVKADEGAAGEDAAAAAPPDGEAATEGSNEPD
jgi:OOP family OmpA-OmpF porin